MTWSFNVRVQIILSVMKCIHNPCQYKEPLMNHGVILILSLITITIASILRLSTMDNQSLYLGCLMLILVVLDTQTSLMLHAAYKPNAFTPNCKITKCRGYPPMLTNYHSTDNEQYLISLTLLNPCS